MKNGLLICSGISKTKNIGDYIQSLAAELFYDQIDVLVEREALSDFKSTPEKTKVIMNGWFMKRPDKWPPSEDIAPLLISMHIVPSIGEKMLTPTGAEYLTKNGPVGCRDTGTVELLKKHGIPCYFSGCLTLALGERYKTEKRRKRSIVFVDPYYECIRNSEGCISLGNIFGAAVSILRNYNTVVRLSRVYKYETELHRFGKLFCIFEKYLQTAAFYRSYSSLFDDEVLLSAEFLSHKVLQSRFNGEKDKFDYAKLLLKKYAEATLVVTSRIHCGLPCLGLETPVIFVTSDNLESDKNSIRSSGRFGGLMSLFRVARYSDNTVSPGDEYLSQLPGKISLDTVIENKADYIPLKTDLIERCRAFVGKEEHAVQGAGT